MMVGAGIAVCGSYEGGVHGWILNNEELFDEIPKLRFSFVAHEKVVRTVTTLTNDRQRLLVSGGDDEILRIYNLFTFRQIGEVGVRRGTINVIRFCGNKHLLCGSTDGSIAVYRTNDWECVHILGGHKAEIKSLASHPSGRMALSTGNDRTLRLWDLTQGRAAFITRTKGTANIIQWSSPSGLHYGFSIAKVIEFRPIDDISGNHVVSLYHDALVLDFTLTETQCITADTSGSLRLWSYSGDLLWIRIRTGLARIKSLGLFLPHSQQEEDNKQNNTSKHSTALLAATSDGQLEIWRLDQSHSEQDQPSVIAHVGTRLTCLTVASLHSQVPDPQQIAHTPFEPKQTPVCNDQSSHQKESVHLEQSPISDLDKKRPASASPLEVPSSKVVGNNKRQKKKKRPPIDVVDNMGTNTKFITVPTARDEKGATVKARATALRKKLKCKLKLIRATSVF
uniref:Uncharacterized protein n=1 Tax=Aureoumbra lagunensis TaxID=44058 RepID=A0A6S8A8U2_9STRA